LARTCREGAGNPGLFAQTRNPFPTRPVSAVSRPVDESFARQRRCVSRFVGQTDPETNPTVDTPPLEKVDTDDRCTPRSSLCRIRARRPAQPTRSRPSFGMPLRRLNQSGSGLQRTRVQGAPAQPTSQPRERIAAQRSWCWRRVENDWASSRRCSRLPPAATAAIRVPPRLIRAVCFRATGSRRRRLVVLAGGCGCASSARRARRSTRGANAHRRRRCTHRGRAGRAGCRRPAGRPP